MEILRVLDSGLSLKPKNPVSIRVSAFAELLSCDLDVTPVRNGKTSYFDETPDAPLTEKEHVFDQAFR